MARLASSEGEIPSGRAGHEHAAAGLEPSVAPPAGGFGQPDILATGAQAG
jgi:hypothetical protein